MFIKNWKIDFAELWKNATPPSKIWAREKRKPSFWLLLALAALTIFCAASEKPSDPWTPALRARGWIETEASLCKNLGPGEFGELESPETEVEVYVSMEGSVWMSKHLAETPAELCRKIRQPSYVEEI